jgi:hypothetical protein
LWLGRCDDEDVELRLELEEWLGLLCETLEDCDGLREDTRELLVLLSEFAPGPPLDHVRALPALAEYERPGLVVRPESTPAGQDREAS